MRDRLKFLFEICKLCTQAWDFRETLIGKIREFGHDDNLLSVNIVKSSSSTTLFTRPTHIQLLNPRESKYKYVMCLRKYICSRTIKFHVVEVEQQK